MQLRNLTIRKLAEMICGAAGMQGGFVWKNFPYRSSSYLTRFFVDCDLDYRHDGSTRDSWVISVLSQVNAGPCQDQNLPSDDMQTVIEHLLNPEHFPVDVYDHAAAIDDVNNALSKDDLRVFFDDGQCFIEHIPTSARSIKLRPAHRALNAAEQARRSQLESFLRQASEDDFTSQVLAPLFQQMGFVKWDPLESTCRHASLSIL